MGRTLYDKVFDLHSVRQLESGQTQLFIGLHLIHEVTSPQAFSMLDERRLSVMYPERTFATVDHIVPTTSLARPYADALAEQMMVAIEGNVGRHEIRFFSPERKEQGIVHVIGPEMGLTQPGMTICCGDSHTATHGAFGALAFGIGTSQVRDVLATQTLSMGRLRVRRVEVNGKLRPGVYAKDVILRILNRLGVKGGVGYAYEYAGTVFDSFSMDERMTACNMSIEGGARAGYVNPNATTYEYLRGRRYAPEEDAWDRAVSFWESIKSDPDATYDDIVRFSAEDIEPVVTWGITPGQSCGISGRIPDIEAFAEDERSSVEEAYRYMGFEPGQPIAGTKIDIAFIGSCTNGRMSDFEEVARLLQRGSFKVAPHVKALVVPGSQDVHRELTRRGYDRLFVDAGFEFREPGCSMCLAMNPDKLEGQQVSASSSNRNFKGRQGSPTGRTLLMSPAMVAAAAIAGQVTDARTLFGMQQ
jgi:3-isopropylmalate/(R)-2-methylmalate dehydratase large subunit